MSGLVAKREYFAGLAMPEVMREYFAGLRNKEFACEPNWRFGIAIDAYEMADAMLQMRDARVTPTQDKTP